MRFRLPAVAVVGIAALLSAGAAVIGTEAAPTAPSGATAFAQRVLSEATVPPGGQRTTGVHTVQVSWLAGSGPTPGIEDVAGAHAFYLYDEPRTTVVHYIETHLPPAAILSGYGTANGVVTEVTETVGVTGPDEYLARLTYRVAATNGTETRSELRIDAKTVWVPPRPVSERAPGSDVVRVTGYRSLSVTREPRGPVTVTLSPSRAQAVLQAFNSLSLGATGSCHEDEHLFVLLIGPPKGTGPSIRAVENDCLRNLGVIADGESLSPLSDRSCALLGVVARDLPDSASATKRVAATCIQARRQGGIPAPTV